MQVKKKLLDLVRDKIRFKPNKRRNSSLYLDVWSSFSLFFRYIIIFTKYPKKDEIFEKLSLEFRLN